MRLSYYIQPVDAFVDNDYNVYYEMMMMFDDDGNNDDDDDVMMMTMMMKMMMMFCTACKLKWAVLLVKGVEPHVHRANQVQCQPDHKLGLIGNARKQKR